MRRRSAILRRRTGAVVLVASACSAGSPALAHGVIGARFFPATLATEDPFVADELSLPTIATFRDEDGDRATEISVEYSKRITRRFGASVGNDWIHLPHASGWGNVETTLKWQFFEDAPSETILSAGLSVEWGGSGAERVGAEEVTTVAPALFFGKGFGDLPERWEWARPFGVTGLVGYAIPTRGHADDERTPYVLTWGLAFEYSLPYMRARVRDHGWPEVVNHLTPLVEVSVESPLRHAGEERTTGTINSGVIWTGRKLQFSAEAIVPVNGESGRGVGAAVQLHYYLDDIFPRSLGRPLFDGARP
jgi:hypothetical protein